jgi:cytochrome c-type biogenesis protein CcmF
MWGEFGFFALMAAGMVAVLQALVPLMGVLCRQPLWQQLAPSLACAQMLAMWVSFFSLMGAFLHNDFSLSYVAEHSNSLLPWYYQMSAVWGGHEGSLLLWVTILATWSGAVALFSRVLPLDMVARVLSILGMVSVAMLAFIVLTSNPFARALPLLPVDGDDLNPLLQDVGLIIHPPMLYMGYVGLAVPFAFAMAGLWAGRMDSALVAAVDAGGMVFFNNRHRARIMVGVLRAGLGRLVVLGSRRKCLVYAMAGGNRLDSLFSGE